MTARDLDFNAGGPPDPRVVERWTEALHVGGNPASLHAIGRRARAVLEDARAEAAAALGVEPREIVFTSGGTESGNAAVRGLGDPALPVLLAATEHPSVRAAAEARGIVEWEVDGEGRAIVAAPGTRFGLVCLVHGQSEIGTLQDVAAAAVVARELGVPLHVDAAQTLGRVPLGEIVRAAQSVTLSVHKAGGLRGASAWVVRTPVRPLLVGGGQQRALRAGTESPALAAATARAIALAVAEQPARAAAMRAARDAFVAALHERLADAARVITSLDPARALVNTALVHFDVLDGRLLLPALDVAGVAASQGSACSSGAPTPPAVLRAMQMSDDDARRCVRFSFDACTSHSDARLAGAIVGDVVTRLRAVRA